MACTLERPTQTDLFNHIKAMFQTTVLGGGNVIPESNEWYVLSNDYALMEEFYAITEQMWRENDPRYACCENLIDLASIDGVFPEPATFATGYATITGIAGTALAALTTITFDAKEYDIISVLPTVLPASGTLTVRIQAQDAGTDGNKDSGITAGTLTTPVVGLDDVVTVGGGLFCGGKDVETCEEFRTRYLERRAFSPVMNFARIRQLILDDWPCTTRVFNKAQCCLPTDPCGCPECQQALELYVMFDDTFDCGIAPDECIAELNLWLFGEFPNHGEGVVDIGICGAVEPILAAQLNFLIYGLDCATANQRTEIEEVAGDYLLTLGPGSKVDGSTIRFAIGEIMGTTENITIDMSLDASVTTDAGTLDAPCNDWLTTCDHIPCLGAITYPTQISVTNGCS